MSKSDRQKKRSQRKRQAPSPPRPLALGANDNAVNDNLGPVTIRGITLTVNQAHRLEVAEARLTSTDAGLQRAGRDGMAALNAEIDRAIAVKEREEAEREMQELAAGRGETYQRGSGKDGTLTIKRDGLETLATGRRNPDGTWKHHPAINQTQRAAGLRYRADYERLDPERQLTPPSPDSIKGPSHGGEGWDQKLREAHDRMMRVRLMIAGVDIPLTWTPGDWTRVAPPRFPANHPVSLAVRALDLVAGQGRTAREITGGGKAHALFLDRLRAGLDCAAIVYEID